MTVVEGLNSKVHDISAELMKLLLTT